MWPHCFYKMLLCASAGQLNIPATADSSWLCTSILWHLCLAFAIQLSPQFWIFCCAIGLPLLVGSEWMSSSRIPINLGLNELVHIYELCSHGDYFSFHACFPDRYLVSTGDGESRWYKYMPNWLLFQEIRRLPLPGLILHIDPSRSRGVIARDRMK